MNAQDYTRCAGHIVRALAPQPGESVLLKADARIFGSLIAPLQAGIREAGAYVSATILSEQTEAGSERELDSMRRLFDDADIFIWLPEIHQGATPAVRRALDEWLDRKRGRSVHFHWASGTYRLPGGPDPDPERVDRDYLAALDVPPEALEAAHDWAIPALRNGPVRVTSADGTDIAFEVGDRPFSKQLGDASPERARSWQVRIDRDVEMPAGVLRVPPLETTANGTIHLPRWRPAGVEGRDLTLTFRDGRLVELTGKNSDAIVRVLDEAGGDARMFREFALGFNPVLRIRPDHPYIGYYGYGAGIVRLSLGDNLEMGGANRGGGVYWNFLPNTTVVAGDKVLVEDGKLAADLEVKP